MKLSEIEALIDEHVDLIVVDAAGLAEAQERCGKFLCVAAILTSYLKDTEVKKTKIKTLERTAFFDSIKQEEGTITEKKLKAEGNMTYTEAREALETVDATITWIKNYKEIFLNAHVMYRQYSRD